MKEIFDLMREQIENKCNYEPIDYDYCDMACSGEQGFIAREDALSAINEAEAKWEADCCEWKWGIDYAQVQCRGDKILFESRRLFTYCPYCGKTIAEVE